MATYVSVAFVDRVERGLVFGRGEWPLHITLVHFTSELPPASIAELMADPARDLLGTAVRIGPDEMFGRRRSVQVSLVEHDPRLQSCHESMVRRLTASDASVTSSRQSMENFRPHVTVTNGRRVHPGDVIELTQVGLVEMRPDGDATIRRIPELWSVE
ncbi:2'-5' RNA ligase family protein [Arthrobacter castelli]|uniref:2'-5' RNA ligase family protein n=1 Tax=Arthrobacter castelli TaxID=271431 RepID=UPI0004241752|nr:2'-5' RNA ligase family protein [Arthrobacter castelli]